MEETKMENNIEISREELERALEEANKKAQAMLDKMTPEERAQAQTKANRAIAENQAAMQKLINEANAVMNSYPPQREMMERNTAQEHGTIPNPGAYACDAAHKPRFCQNCGAQAGSGKYCEYCGSAL